VLTGYRCRKTGLWRVPLKKVIVNENTDTIIFDGQDGIAPSNDKYAVPTSNRVRDYIATARAHAKEEIKNVYELPSIEQTIRYLHAAAGFPTKATWLKAIRHGNYVSWPLINVKNVNKYFPESEETQYGHMRGSGPEEVSGGITCPDNENVRDVNGKAVRRNSCNYTHTSTQA